MAKKKLYIPADIRLKSRSQWARGFGKIFERQAKRSNSKVAESYMRVGDDIIHVAGNPNFKKGQILNASQRATLKQRNVLSNVNTTPKKSVIQNRIKNKWVVVNGKKYGGEAGAVKLQQIGGINTIPSVSEKTIFNIRKVSRYNQPISLQRRVQKPKSSVRYGFSMLSETPRVRRKQFNFMPLKNHKEILKKRIIFGGKFLKKFKK